MRRTNPRKAGFGEPAYSLRLLQVPIVTFIVCVLGVLSPAPVLAQQTDKLAFVVRDWFTAVYNSKFLDECPTGLTTPNDEIWWRNLTKEKRGTETNNGLVQTLRRQGRAMRRGSNNEEVCFNPTAVKDPPPTIVEGIYSFGDNLDGTVDGRATPKTCAHQKFVGLDGTSGIDNQLYRLFGCHYGWLIGGGVDTAAHEMRGTSGLGMILIEVTGVSDTRNSEDVTVTFYRSIDQFAVDGTGRPVPYSSYRIHAHPDGTPVYGDSLKGSITNGVLETERGNVLLPFYGHYNFMSNVFRDMALTLEISPDGTTAKGMVTGYYDLADYLYYQQGMSGHTSAGDNCPSSLDMAYQLADGYPDPKTGVCTHISSAFEITTYAAFAVRSQRDSEREEKTALR